LDLKKTLVDLGLLDISLPSFEERLFEVLEYYGYGGSYVDRYRMMTRYSMLAARSSQLLLNACGII